MIVVVFTIVVIVVLTLHDYRRGNGRSDFGNGRGL